MNRMNRDEHAARLEAYRAQGEAEYYKERAARQAQIHDTTEAFRRFVEQDGRKTRITFVVCTLTGILSIAAVNVALISTMQNSFDAGVQSAAIHAEMKASIEQINEKLDAMESRAQQMNAKLDSIDTRMPKPYPDRHRGGQYN